ncbi:DeoR family transcriptional regulator [Klebsiella pneumoniae]|uniref:DeoR family transcriptional regulator n=1 Tax=Klebsiella pneumoniae TaxID=573 RepID=UPI000A55E540
MGVSINELTEILGVSHMTIRREPSHLVKSTLQSEEKQAIGALAASHIAKNSCIYLDAGLPPWRWRGRSSTGTISRWSPMILR